jgi:transposase
MGMIRPGFLSPEERLELEACVRRQREDHGIARRANAILLLDDGRSCQEIATFLYLDDDTIRGWHKAYQRDGWEALAVDAWKGGQSRVTQAQEAVLCEWLEARLRRSTVEIRSHIAAEFGLHYSHSGCIKLLARLGFEYRKPKPLPQVAPVEKQKEFIALYERLMASLAVDEAVYFADAVHPEYQTKPAFGWVRAGSRPAVKTTAGRGRVNIHGALDLETFDAPFVEPTTVDGVSAAQLLARIEARNPDKRVIHVIWDNAAYHKGPDVRAFLARPDCRIHLIQLPPYCPHLNPIERLWAVMHQRVTHNRHYPTQKQFADAILAFFRETIPKEWKTFRDKVSDNFRVISHQKFRLLEA